MKEQLKPLSFINLALVILLLSSCNSSTQQTEVELATAEELLPFSGQWISKDYYACIQKTKSPLVCQEGAVMMVIPESTGEIFGSVHNFHEGGGPYAVFKEDKKFIMYYMDESGKKLSRVGEVKQLNNNSLKIDSVEYVQITNFASANEKHVLERIVFAGKYKNQKGKLITLGLKGEVSGHPVFTYYQPAIDYMDAGMQVDQVLLGQSEQDTTYYGFIWKGDTLKLYQLKCLTREPSDKRCVEVEQGTLLESWCKVFN